MSFLWLKSLHIIFVVTWFAGLFYIIRLFIYQTEAQDKSEIEKNILTDQFKLMSRRLWYGITWPSAVLTLIFGTSVLWQRPFYLEEPWMHIKLTFVILLFVYHYLSHRVFKKLQNDIYSYSSTQLRIWNEVATLILFAVVFLVVFKTATDWLFGLFGLVLFAITLMMAIKWYKKKRERE